MAKQTFASQSTDSWLSFLVDWKSESITYQRQLIKEMQQRFEKQKEMSLQILKKQEEQSQKVIEAQKKKLREMDANVELLAKKISCLQEREHQKEVAEKEAANRRARFDKRERKPSRDAATFPEFQHAISVIQQKNPHQNFVKSRGA